MPEPIARLQRLRQALLLNLESASPANYAGFASLVGRIVQRPYRKSLGVGDRVAITVGAFRELRAVVIAVGPRHQLTLQPDGWQRGVVLQISGKHVRRENRQRSASLHEKAPPE